MQNARSGPLKVLGDSLRENPETLLTNQIKAFKMLYSGSYAYVEVGLIFIYRLKGGMKYFSKDINENKYLVDFI